MGEDARVDDADMEWAGEAIAILVLDSIDFFFLMPGCGAPEAAAAAALASSA